MNKNLMMLLRTPAASGGGSNPDVKGSASANANSVALPSHVAGDVILVFAYRNGLNTPPTLPAGFTQIPDFAGGNSNSANFGYKVAASSSETSGVWTNATHVIALVISGAAASPVGGSATTTGNSTTVTYPAITMSVTDGTSLVLGIAGHRSSDTNLETPPSGMTFVSGYNGSGELAAHKKVAASSWSSSSVSVGGTAFGWRSLVVEIKKA